MWRSVDRVNHAFTARLWRSASLIVAAILIAVPASGQVVGANVGGVVVDETGAALPGVTVTITNKANGRQQVLVTSSEGKYRAVALQPAPYEIAADLAGFSTAKREIVLIVGADLTVDFTVGVAAVQETVTVVGETPLVEVAKSQPSSAVVGDQIASLPVLDRQFLTLAQLLPGSGPNNQSQRFSTTKFGGVADQRNGYTTLIDGGSIDDAIWGSPTINITQDAVQEFKVFRNQFDAQYGSALTAVVTVVTKSGSNRFSGSGFYFGRDRRLNARNAFAAEKEPFDQQRYGGSFGGPIVLNKTHFFGTYEYNNVDRVKILALPPSNPFATRENGIFPADSYNHLAVGRVDHRFNDSRSLFARFAFENQKALRTGNASSDSNEIDDENRTRSFIVEDNWILSQNKVNSLRVHLLKHYIGTVPHSDEVGIGRPSVTTGRNQVNPQFFPRTRIELHNTLYVNMARHDFKFGGDVSWAGHDFEAHFFEKGVFVFGTDAPFNPDDPRTWPISFTMQKPGFFNYKSWEIALFAQDDWRIWDRVRLNLGVRYDIDTNMRLNDFYAQLLQDPGYAALRDFGRSANAGADSNNVQPRLGVTYDLRGNGTMALRAGWGMYTTRNRPWFQLRTMNQLASSAVRIEDPALLRFFPDVNRVLGGKSLDEFVRAGGPRLVGTLIPDDAVLPYAQNTTVGIGWQLNPVSSLDIDYVHGFGNRQLGFTDQNLPPSGPISRTNPRPYPQFTQVLALENFTKSWYDALETQLRTRVLKTGSLQISYTLSRSYLDGVDFFLTRRGTERTPQERGYNVSDQRHNLTLAGSTMLPWDIQLSGIVKLISGSPIKVQAGFDLDGDGSITGDRPRGLPTTVGREKVDESLKLINELRASRNLRPIDRELLKLDPYVTVDVRGTKIVRLGGERRLELFFEAYNLTNHVNFEPFTVNGSIISGAFLLRRSARDARQIQWGARYAF